MARTVTHLSKIRKIGRDSFRTGTACNRMVGSGDFNCSTDELDVTCKFCLRMIETGERSIQIEWNRAA